MLDPHGPGQRRESPQIDQSWSPRGAVETTGRGDATRQSTDDLLVDQWKQGGADPFKNDQAQRIRAEIDDADATEPFGGAARFDPVQRTTSLGWPCRTALPRPDRLGLVIK